MSFLCLFVTLNLTFLGIMGIVMPDKTGQHANVRNGIGFLVAATFTAFVSVWFKLDEISTVLKGRANGKQTTDTPEGVRREGDSRLVRGRDGRVHKNET